ncbi:hypothetical protein HK104_004616 [Borealophlyctis nickersoniae]|nr:hypothetical protein HK104_004616 [Borealophlyctis nickersoniae]
MAAFTPPASFALSTCILFISEQLAELAKEYGTIQSIEMDSTISQSKFVNLYCNRFAHIVFTSPAAATDAQKAIDGLVVDGRKLCCIKVPDQAYGNVPRTLSITPVVHVNPVPGSLPVLGPLPVLGSLPVPDHWGRQSQRNPQFSRRENVKSLQKAGAKDVTIDLTGDKNTVDDHSDRGPPCTAPSAEHSTASASNLVSQAGTTTLAGAREVTADLASDENMVNDRLDCSPPRTAPAEHSTASASNLYPRLAPGSVHTEPCPPASLAVAILPRKPPARKVDLMMIQPKTVCHRPRLTTARLGKKIKVQGR